MRRSVFMVKVMLQNADAKLIESNRLLDGSLPYWAQCKQRWRPFDPEGIANAFVGAGF